MIDEKKLNRWIAEQIDNPQLTKDMKIILSILQGTIDSGVFEKATTTTVGYTLPKEFTVNDTYTTGHNENETVVVE